MNIVKLFRASTLVLAATLVAATASAQTTNWKIDPAHSGVEFKVRHLAVSNVRGTLTIAKGVVHLDEKDITKSSVEATIDANSVDTHTAARDTHLKSADFFNVAQYPTLEFKSTALSKSGGDLILKGDLTLAGVTKPVTLTVDGPAPPQTDAKGTTRSGFSATGTLHRSDFNFGSKFPSAVIGDDVKFTIDAEAAKQ